MILHNCYEYDIVVSLVMIFTAIAIDMITTVNYLYAKSFHVSMNYVPMIHPWMTKYLVILSTFLLSSV